MATLSGYCEVCTHPITAFLLRPETSTKGGDAHVDEQAESAAVRRDVAGAGLDDGSGPSVLPQAFTELQERATAAKLADDVTEFAWRRLANDLHALLQRDPAPSTEAKEEIECARCGAYMRPAKELRTRCPDNKPHLWPTQPVSPEPTPTLDPCSAQIESECEIQPEPTPEDPEAVEVLAKRLFDREMRRRGVNWKWDDLTIQRKGWEDEARLHLTAITPLLPGLGEEERERLKEIAKVLDAVGTGPMCESANDDAAFLRDLADRPVSEDPLGELLALAPHEISCRCDKGGTFEWAEHDLSCPRREVGELLSRLTKGAQS